MNRHLFEFVMVRTTWAYDRYVDDSRVEFVVVAENENEARNSIVAASAALKTSYYYKIKLKSVKQAHYAN